eukprot:CAMPEP_0117888362 /NCGR_PEP_ID=MMETSP0950-20121206/21809_1 /TAXON_ID=44440 /ORGANISM="Chattonella subsalsa, Strain CCMP2191" /LENGTH=268 /DNA_ID=CAMNT_0005746663 /DNA_START=35 /DNA_END=841 /DNA_ORIENTATION=+
MKASSPVHDEDQENDDAKPEKKLKHKNEDKLRNFQVPNSDEHPIVQNYAWRDFDLTDKVTIIWLVIDAVTHLTIEFGYCLLSLLNIPPGEHSSIIGFIWNEYGKADQRWAVRDPVILSIELLTVLAGVLCIVILHAIWYQMPYRHVLQVVLCVCELYGGWMTFMPEWLSGSTSLNTSCFMYTWVYLFFMNGLWVWVPLILLWESFAQITEACKISQKGTSDTSDKKQLNSRPGNFWIASVIGFLVLYVILVPAVLILAKVSAKEGLPS